MSSSNSEVNLFDESDSGSETELEIDDSDSDTQEPVAAAASTANEDNSDANSEFDDSGSTVLLLSSNDIDNESGSDTDVEEVTQDVDASSRVEEQVVGLSVSHEEARDTHSSGGRITENAPSNTGSHFETRKCLWDVKN